MTAAAPHPVPAGRPPRGRALPFRKLDAFAAGGSGGNPAAAVRLGAPGELDAADMQRIARELKGYVSEVGFVARTGPGRLWLRYYSSEREVAFCGHATIAILYDLVVTDPEFAAQERILLETPKGLLPVENRTGAEDAVYIQAPEPEFGPVPAAPAEILAALGVPAGELDPSLPWGVVDAGNRTLCLPLATARAVAAARPEFAALLAFCQRHRLDVVNLFSRDCADPANQLRTRVFAAPFGYLEDPATGSGNAALGYHLHRTGHWDGRPIRIEQGPDLACPNLVRLASVPDPEHGIRVRFGGGAVLRVSGTYHLEPASAKIP
jgi:PhzF family phenazine biosynthesis protein